MKGFNVLSSSVNLRNCHFRPLYNKELCRNEFLRGNVNKRILNKYPVVDEFATLLLYLPDVIYEVPSSIESILFKLFAEQGVDYTYVYLVRDSSDGIIFYTPPQRSCRGVYWFHPQGLGASKKKLYNTTRGRTHLLPFF